MKPLIRTLARQYPTAQAIRGHLAATVEVQRTEPVTFADLLDALGAENVRALDAQLAASKNAWLQQQLAANGVDLTNAKYRAVFGSLSGLPRKTLDDILAIGSHETSQWDAYGLTSLPELAEIEACLTPPKVDGHAISVAVNLSPAGEHVAVSVTAMDGTERLGIVHSFTAGRRNLSHSQQDFLAALITLAKAYRDEVT